MSKVFGKYGARSRWIPSCIYHFLLKGAILLGKCKRLYRFQSRYSQHKMALLKSKLNAGETVYLVGIGVIGHNTGVSLVSVSAKEGITVISNHEEERFSGRKHDGRFPLKSLAVLKVELDELGLSVNDIHCILGSFDYLHLFATMIRTLFEHFPFSFPLLSKESDDNCNYTHILPTLNAPKRLSEIFDYHKLHYPIIGMPHHENHAYFAYAVSPFIVESGPVLLSVIDGTGDRGAISMYLASAGQIDCLYHNESVMDSLGMLYGYISATQGGWSFLSSEGRYMGAAAWGNRDRLTNPYYAQLKQLCYFGEKGTFYINRKMAGWHLAGQARPYRRLLKNVLGEPIKKKDMWDPDAVLSVDEIKHSPITQARVDKAAALQLVFEDVLCHIIGHYIRETGAEYLVLSGGTALNCVANSVLLSHFNEMFYKRYLNKSARLSIWIPPVPADSGAIIGGPYQFAMKAGAQVRTILDSPFLCGISPRSDEIHKACSEQEVVRYQKVGNIKTPEQLHFFASFIAQLIANNAIIGIYQGRAESGPRALGHRSILANPCDPRIRDRLNQRVKYREIIRPLAPMMTLSAAKALYHLSKGASQQNYMAYDYMVLTAKAKETARALIPGVIHQDGTSRIQIVRQENNPLIYEILYDLGQVIGVEVAVNTSLNVGSPIVQTPKQAMGVLSKAKGMTGLIMLSEESDVWLVENRQIESSVGILNQFSAFKSGSLKPFMCDRSSD